MKRQGFVLINTLIVSLIALIMILGLNYSLFYSTRFTGFSKRYTSALEAAKGGALKCIEAIEKCTIQNSFKCRESTENWEVNNLENARSRSKPEDIINHADWHKSYGNYEVWCKIVDTRYNVVKNSYFYAIEVVARKSGGDETAWLAVGYLLERPWGF